MKIELSEKRYCVCGAQLPNDERVKYCSSKCEIETRRKYMRERMQKLRAQRWTDEMSAKMGWLKDNQQVEPAVIYLFGPCWVCGSTKDLIPHHVKYGDEKTPVIVKVLCRSCHEFLHKSLFRGKKCKVTYVILDKETTEL